MTSQDDLAALLNNIVYRLTLLENRTQLSSTTVGDDVDTAVVVEDVVSDAVVSNEAIPGLQDQLASNDDDLAAAAVLVDAAIAAAQEASDAGLAAADAANEAADEALVKAQEALDAAAQAGGGATYTGRAPTSDDPGKDGQQWFVWDSNYKITAYYVYDGDSSSWVQTEITDAVLGNIDAGSITSGYVGADRIAAASLTAAVLAADTLTSREIGADAILARNIKAGEVTAGKLAADSVAAGNIQAGAITAGKIAANSITSAQIQANSITATEINLDTLNGKTITGAVIKSAASGNRLEINGTVMAVYSTKQAAPVGGIQAVDDGSFSAVQILNQFQSSNQSAISVNVPRNPGAGSYESTRKYNLQVSHGMQGPLVQTNQITSDNYPNSPYPVMAHTAANQPIYVTADRFRIGSGLGRNVIFGSGGTFPAPSTVVVQADDFQLADGSSIVRKATAGGTVTHAGNIAAGAFGNTLNINFPTGMFTAPPYVVANASNSRIMTAPASITTTGASIGLGNWSTGTAGGPIVVNWVAFASN